LLAHPLIILLLKVFAPFGAIAAAIAIALSLSTNVGCTALEQPKTKGYVDGSFLVHVNRDMRAVRTVISKAGVYCVEGSMHIDGQINPFTIEGSKLFSDDDQLLIIRSDDVVIDFGGYNVTSDAQLDSAISTPYVRKYVSSFVFPPPQAPMNITLKNAAIKIDRTGVGIRIRGLGPETYANTLDEMRELMGSRSTWTSAERDANAKHTGNRIRILSEMFPAGPSAYPIRNLRLENLKIKTKQDAVILEGASTVIRDSVIETDSGTAIWLYGPNAILENNTIIVHCLETKTVNEGLATCRDLDAPIRLMHGDGAVIRNNRFILKGKAHQRVISVFETGAFTFQNNTIVGLNHLGSIAKAFTGNLQMTEVNNQLDNGPWSIFKSWFSY
jgi:Right handed beta helix region